MEHNSDGNKSDFARAIGASPQAALLSDLRTPPMQQETLTSVALQPLLSSRFQYALIESFDKSIYTMIDPEKTELEEFLKEYARVRCNAVFFVENYWNKLHSDKPSYSQMMRNSNYIISIEWFHWYKILQPIQNAWKSCVQKATKIGRLTHNYYAKNVSYNY